jgi:hypothetical protein
MITDREITQILVMCTFACAVHFTKCFVCGGDEGGDEDGEFDLMTSV